MGITHLSIYKGMIQRILAQSATPSDRENAEYYVNGGNKTTLEDGDWYYDTDTNTLRILVGSTWMNINFGF